MRSWKLRQTTIGVGAILVLLPGVVGAATVGVFPVRVASPNAADLGESGLGDGLPALLVQSLGQTGGLEAKALQWPVAAEDGELPPAPFGALVAAARAENVNGFVVLIVTQFELDKGEKREGGGLLGGLGIKLPGGKKAKAEARVGLEGGLIDSLTEAVVAPVRGQQVVAVEGYDGPPMEELVAAGLDSEAFQQSPLGQATQQAIADMARQVAEGAAKLSPQAAPTPRDGAPEGLSFTQAEYQMTSGMAANQWSTVEVFNGGDAERRFVVVADPGAELTLGVMGSGSPDAPCALPPGQWKRVRVVANLEFGGVSSYVVPLRLYDVTDTTAPEPGDAEAWAALQPHDSAPLTVEVVAGLLELKVDHVADDPIRLGQTYEITNEGDETIADFTVTATGEWALQLAMAPTVDHYPLASGQSLRVTFYPLLDPDFRELRGTALLRGLGQEQPLPLSFALPAGGKVFMAQGGSKCTYDAKNSYCTNAGGGSTDVGGPAGPGAASPDECKQQSQLEKEIEGWQYLQGQYDRLSKDQNPETKPKDWKDLNDRVCEQAKRDRGLDCKAAGEIDPETHKVNVNREAFADLPEPTRSWYEDAVKTHEGRHDSDISGWQRDGTWRFRARDPEALGETEHNAYGDSIKKLQDRLNDLKRRCGGQGGFLPLEMRPQGGGAVVMAPAGDSAARGVAEAGPVCYRLVDPMWGGELSDADWGSETGYYLATTFSMPYSRSVYTPHDTLIALNGHEVGRLMDMMPEGTYLFRFDPRYLNAGGHNVIQLSVPRVNQAHYFIANDFQLLAPVSDRDRFVVAASQEEANRLYQSLGQINHNQPDLLIAADATRDVPAEPEAGEVVSFRATAVNVGAAASKPSLLRILNYDPRETEKAEKPSLERGPSATVDYYVAEVNKIANPGRLLDRSRLRQVGKPVPIPALEPDTSADLTVTVTYKPGETTRLYLVADTKADFDPSNNVGTVTFVSPEGASPIAGTDYPVLDQVPLLSNVLQLPQIPEVEAFTRVRVGNFIDQVPYLRDLGGLGDRLDINRWLPF